MQRQFRRKKFCRFTAEGVKEIDYKDLETSEDSTSPRPARSYRAVSRARARAISVNSRWRSNARDIWRCCRTPTPISDLRAAKP